jgi:hypothetical protein
MNAPGLQGVRHRGFRGGRDAAGSHDAAGKHGTLALVGGDVVIWDNHATQHKAVDDYGNQPRIVRRVTIDGPISVGIDGQRGEKMQQRCSGHCSRLKRE